MGGIKIRIQRPFFLFFKKHFCSKCNTKLKRVFLNKLIHRDSLEAQRLDIFTPTGLTYFGSLLTYAWIEFRCPKCTLQSTINEQYYFEKSKR
jgi:hypothetical protein